MMLKYHISKLFKGLYQIVLSKMTESFTTFKTILINFLQNSDYALWTNPETHMPKLKIYVHEKLPSVVISDGIHYMEAIHQLTEDDKTNEDSSGLNPLNKIRTDFYNFSIKRAKYFDYPLSKAPPEKSIVANDFERKSAYFPEFHFDSRFKKYCEEERPKWIKQVNFQYRQCLQVTKWSILLVNIANSGYYAPILKIQQCTPTKSKVTKKLQPLTNILYIKEIEQLLQQKRIRDLQKLYSQAEEPASKEISLFYYMKKMKMNRNQQFLSDFISLDKKCKFLMHNPSVNISYVPIGGLSGVQRFIRPIASNLKQRKQFNLTLEALNKFHETRTKTRRNAQQQSESESEELWSEQEVQEYNEERERGQGNNENEMESESSENEQQPLKLIYLKQMKMNKIV